MTKNLFLSAEPYREEKTADVILSRDGTDWEEDISQNLHKEHPYLQEKNIEINMTHKNPEQGAGVGSIKIDDKIMIPVIVERFRMAPLDLFWHDQKLFPMNRVSLESALQETAIGTPVTPGQGEMSDVSMYSQAQPPFDGKYTYASHFEGVGSSDDLKEALASAFDTDEGLVYQLKGNEIFRESVARIPVGHEKAAERQYNVEVSFQADSGYEKIASSGLYDVATSTGPVTGFVADFVIGMDGRPYSGRGMFIGLDKHASYASLDPGQQLVGRRPDPETVSYDTTMQMNQSGVFMKHAGDNKFICTEQVTPKYRRNGGIQALDGFGQPMTIQKVAGIRVPVRQGNEVMVPDDWSWMPTGRRVHPMPAAKMASVSSADQGAILFEDVDPSVDTEKLATALREAYPGTNVYVTSHYVDRPAPAPVKVAPVNLFKEASYIKPCDGYEVDFGSDIIKIAAVEEMQARDTVDSLLGLNFVTPENIHRFLDKLPVLEEARDHIAKLLLASRLGLNTDSRPLRTAMFAIDSVIRDLEEVRHETEDYE